MGNFKLLRIAALINAIGETKRVRLINGYFIGKKIKNVGKTPLCSKIDRRPVFFRSQPWSYGRMIIETLIKGGECV